MQRYDSRLEAREIADTFMRRYRRIQVLCVLIAVVLLFFIFTNFFTSDNAGISPVLILFVAGAIYLARSAFSFYQLYLINKICDEDCDPEKFTGVYEIFSQSRVFRRRKLSVMLNIAHGSVMSGDYARAADILKSIRIGQPSPHLQLQLQYYYILARCCYETGDFKNVEHARAMIGEISQKLKPGSRNVKNAQRAADIIDAKLAAHHKRFGDAMKLENALLLSAKFPIQVVSYMYNTAELYFDQGDYANARSRFEFVIENGNKLFCAKKAREMLEQCNIRAPMEKSRQ